MNACTLEEKIRFTISSAGSWL
ncbi:hypothetical protein [Chitinophaga rupis]